MANDTQGVDVASYELWLDAGGDLTSAFTKLTDLLTGTSIYDGSSATITHTITQADAGLGAAGTLYRVKVRAKNSDDVVSGYSDELVVALGSVPAAPATPTKDLVASGPGQIALEWAANTADTLPVYGYRLYSDLGTEGGF
jgi:hypothetical protein